jgi:Rrf2 family transcriptional regulator, iron-sulfur cluster assembly transcription factor
MSLISRTAQYALRAMTVLAAQEDRMTVKDLAGAVGAPQPYLARIIMTLADTGMVDARRGPGGGLKLGRGAGEISLMEIVRCFDGDTLFERCALGLPGCKESDPKCPIHEDWTQIRDHIKSWWDKTTLDQFSPQNTQLCMKERIAMQLEQLADMPRRRGRWQ